MFSLVAFRWENPPPPWARKFFLVGAYISSLKLTMQRYGIMVAVLEFFRDKIHSTFSRVVHFAGQNGQGQNGQNRKINCQNPSL